MYNADFKVKYFDIKEELMISLKHDNVVTTQDIIDICDKLYTDELISVFYADSILDDKIDIGMKCIKEIMMENSEFKSMIEEISLQDLIFKLLELPNTGLPFIKEDIFDIICCMLFSEQLFYLLHQCICHQLKNTIIPEYLLLELKNKITNILQNSV
jgi:Mg2+/Co2+ transporter CorC